MTKTNKLVEGLIPKGQACPFLEDCGSFLIDKGRCPTKSKPKQVDFSCGLARGHALIKRYKDD